MDILIYTQRILSFYLDIYQLYIIMDQQCIKELMYEYKFNDFAIFSIVILNLLKRDIIKQEVVFSECCMEYSALIRTKKGGKIYFFLDLSSRVLHIFKIGFLNKRELIKSENNTDLYNLDTILRKYVKIILS